jgi:hypothetical protein
VKLGLDQEDFVKVEFSLPPIMSKLVFTDLRINKDDTLARNTTSEGAINECEVQVYELRGRLVVPPSGNVS